MRKLLFTIAGSICILAALAACSAEPASSAAAASSTVASVAEQAPESAPAENAALGIGESGTLGDWGITVTGFEVVDRVESDYMYFSPDEGNHYGVVYLSVINNGKEAANFLPTFSMYDDVQADIYFGDGYEFTATNLLGHNNELHDSTLNPLTTKEGIIAFSLPDAVTSSEEPLSFVLSAGSDTLTYALR